MILHGFNTVAAGRRAASGERPRRWARDNARWLAAQRASTRSGSASITRAWSREPGRLRRRLPRRLPARSAASSPHEGIFTLLDVHQDQLTRTLRAHGRAPQPRVRRLVRHGRRAAQPAAARLPGPLTPSIRRSTVPTTTCGANATTADGHGPRSTTSPKRGAGSPPASRRRQATDRLRPVQRAVAGLAITPSCASTAGRPPGGFDQTSLTRVLRDGDRRPCARPTAVRMVFVEPNLQFDFGAPDEASARSRRPQRRLHLPRLLRAGPSPYGNRPSPGVPMPRRGGAGRSTTREDADRSAPGIRSCSCPRPGSDPNAASAHRRARRTAGCSTWQWWDYDGDNLDFVKPALPNLIRPYPAGHRGNPEAVGV